MNSLCPERVDENRGKAVRVGNKEDDGIPLSSRMGCFTGSAGLTRSLCLRKNRVTFLLEPGSFLPPS